MNEMLNKIIKNKDEKTQAKNIQLVDFRCIRFSQLKIKNYFKIHQKNEWLLFAFHSEYSESFTAQVLPSRKISESGFHCMMELFVVSGHIFTYLYLQLAVKIQ